MSDPFDYAYALQDAFARAVKAVDEVTAGLDAFKRERALFALTSAYSLIEEMWIFKADPARPPFTDRMAHGRKTAGDSPYTVYLTSPVDPRHQYRLRGNIGDATYYGIQIYRQVNGFNAPSGVLNDSELVKDGSGNFEVIVSCERPAGALNWMRLVDGDYLLMTRAYRYDPVLQRPAQISIERIDSAPSEPPPLIDRVAKAASYFEAVVFSTIEIASLLSVNQFSPPDAEVRTPKCGDSLFPTKAIHCDGFFVKLEPGQAIKLSGRLPDKWRYVSFVFYDRWYATADYPKVRCYQTGATSSSSRMAAIPSTCRRMTPVTPTGFRWASCARGCSHIATC